MSLEAESPPPAALPSLDVTGRGVASRALQGLAMHVLLRLRGLVVVPILARLLGPEGLGVVTLAGACVGFGAPLLSLGLPVGLSLRLVDERDPAAVARGWSSALKLALLSALAGGGLAALALASPFGGPALQPLRGCAAAVGLLLATTALREVAVTMPQLRQRTGLVAAFNLFLDYGGALLAVALVWSGLGPAAVIWAQGGVAALGIALASLRTRAELGWSPGVDRAFLGSALAVGLPVLPVGLGQWALQSLDNLFLAAWHGEAALGSYGLAYTLASPVTLVLASANFVFFPTASAVLKEGRERLRAFLARAFRLAAAALGLLVCGALLLAPWAVRLLAGPRYPTAAQVLPALALAWALFTLLQLLQFVELVIARRTARIAAAYGGMAALNVALNFALIPGLGIQGAALATVLSYAGGLLLMGLLAHRALPEFGWWRPFLAGAAPGLALAPAAALLAVPPSAPLWQAAASTAALVAGFLGLARATGAIGAHDLELARSLLDRR